jgi:AcrR family transcriptional regulator
MRADARRNRARLLEIAQQVFATEGLAVPIDEIARRAGVGIGTVYRHFPTKEALFEAIVLDRIQRLTDLAASTATGDPGEAFFTYFRCMIEAGSVDKALFDTLAVSAGVDRDAILGASRALLATLGDLLTRAQAAGAVRPDITPADLKAIMAGALAMERQSAGEPGRMIDIVCGGLRAESEAPTRSESGRVTPSG